MVNSYSSQKMDWMADQCFEGLAHRGTDLDVQLFQLLAFIHALIVARHSPNAN
jgi:hypothetical protein